MTRPRKPEPKQDGEGAEQGVKEGETQGQDAQALRAQIQEYRNLLQRLQADFENYRRRAEKERAEAGQVALQEFLTRILPVLDSFELALKGSRDPAHFAKGFELIYAQLHATLEGMGLRGIQSTGERFDPYKHEALMQEASDRDNIILEEFQKGYALNDTVLRHSKVKIGRKQGGHADEHGQDEHGQDEHGQPQSGQQGNSP